MFIGNDYSEYFTKIFYLMPQKKFIDLKTGNTSPKV